MSDTDFVTRLNKVISQSYSSIDILGVTYNIVPILSIRNNVIIDSENFTINIYHNSKTNYIAILRDFFMKSCVDYLNGIFIKVQEKFSLHNLYAKYPPKYRFYRGRWGSCRKSTGEIALNYSLYHLSPQLIEHVVIHEFCHLKYANHSPDFYDFLYRFDRLSKVNNHRMKQLGGYIGYFQLFDNISTQKVRVS